MVVGGVVSDPDADVYFNQWSRSRHPRLRRADLGCDLPGWGTTFLWKSMLGLGLRCEIDVQASSQTSPITGSIRMTSKMEFPVATIGGEFGSESVANSVANSDAIAATGRSVLGVFLVFLVIEGLYYDA